MYLTKKENRTSLEKEGQKGVKKREREEKRKEGKTQNRIKYEKKP